MLDHLGTEGSGIQFDDSGLDSLSGIDQEDNSMLSSNQNQPGILTLALNELFESVRQREKDENKVYIIRCSYFEIYNDQIYDLLVEDFVLKNDPLSVVEDSKKKEFIIRNLTEVIVEDFNECINLLKLGEKNRTYA